ncbi:MAG: hypothetical protein LJE70_14005 [Chromatiaceae bacterium]|nr:hypothetical protein [Chromatiaceae bacterium]
MFRAYLGEPARYARCFAGDWYLTGDLAQRDRDGYLKAEETGAPVGDLSTLESESSERSNKQVKANK